MRRAGVVQRSGPVPAQPSLSAGRVDPVQVQVQVQFQSSAMRCKCNAIRPNPGRTSSMTLDCGWTERLAVYKLRGRQSRMQL